MNSSEYRNLIRNTRKLEKQLLGFSRKVDVDYTERQLTLCRAFVAFSHAEVEYYLEQRALKILARAKTKWLNESCCNVVIPALLSYKEGKTIKPPDNPTGQANEKRLNSLVLKAISYHENYIESNNGIKPRNISNIFIPLGMNPDDIENDLMIKLDKLGRRRGDFVHQSSNVSLPNLNDPFDELNDLNYLTADLHKFDEVTRRLE